MPATIIEFQNVSDEIEGAVIKVQSEDTDGHQFYYIDPETMGDWNGGAMDLNNGRELPGQIGLLPEEEREVLRDGPFPKEDTDESGNADE